MTPRLAATHELFGLGAPELIVVLIILLVLFGGSRVAAERTSGAQGDAVVALGVVFVTCVGILLWHQLGR